MKFHAEVPTPGRFSVYNALCAIAICRHFGVPAEKIQDALLHAHVKGRIELVRVSDSFTLMIDYAHNAVALESLLKALREYHPERLVTLFGCGGNRSRLRRFEMGEVSGKLSDFTKGHEDYQEIKGKKYPMDERVIIQDILREDAQVR